LAHQLERLGDRLHQSFRHDAGTVGMGDADLDDGELVAAQARDRVLGADAVGQTLGNLAQQLVAGSVAAQIVHML